MLGLVSIMVPVWVNELNGAKCELELGLDSMKFALEKSFFLTVSYI